MREARISDGRTRSATENEIGSINAARAGPSAPLRSPTMTEAARRRAAAKRAKRLGAESPSARARERERKRSVSPRSGVPWARARRRDNKPTPAPRGTSVVAVRRERTGQDPGRDAPTRVGIWSAIIQTGKCPSWKSDVAQSRKSQ